MDITISPICPINPYVGACVILVKALFHGLHDAVILMLLSSINSIYDQGGGRESKQCIGWLKSSYVTQAWDGSTREQQRNGFIKVISSGLSLKVTSHRNVDALFDVGLDPQLWSGHWPFVELYEIEKVNCIWQVQAQSENNKTIAP